ncbi:hypothetical protein AR158_C190L [Paramecium bursaria Chlorella virus AR158]|uniref:hypothetical protein n=1 Tax=Paramecium bursaria Chlorella virus AR158 TaxID=380598 RepID=UPI00015AA84F|nr:hypothetical protein AR158_C190L [Paramecium bursaria Chlorella virus AR158]ABU43736.1 hypothetical protein AR158_C190L [Paramecium bursaria Chlorella virus AR158]
MYIEQKVLPYPVSRERIPPPVFFKDFNKASVALSCSSSFLSVPLNFKFIGTIFPKSSVVTRRSRVSFAQYLGTYTYSLSLLKILNFLGNNSSRVKGETVSSRCMSFFSFSVRSVILILTPDLDTTPNRLIDIVRLYVFYLLLKRVC